MGSLLKFKFDELSIDEINHINKNYQRIIDYPDVLVNGMSKSVIDKDQHIKTNYTKVHYK